MRSESDTSPSAPCMAHSLPEPHTLGCARKRAGWLKRLRCCCTYVRTTAPSRMALRLLRLLFLAGVAADLQQDAARSRQTRGTAQHTQND
jgi:hypothetical protein